MPVHIKVYSIIGSIRILGSENKDGERDFSPPPLPFLARRYGDGCTLPIENNGVG
jgi:hypothetical protein